MATWKQKVGVLFGVLGLLAAAVGLAYGIDVYAQARKQSHAASSSADKTSGDSVVDFYQHGFVVGRGSGYIAGYNDAQSGKPLNDQILRDAARMLEVLQH